MMKKMSKKNINVLYGINATGQGHINRARKLVPLLSKHVNIDLLISGAKQKVELPKKPTYSYKGLTFYYQKGRINWLKTIIKNNIFKVLIDILTCPVSKYHFVITDFEPISAWAAFIKRKKSIHISHQISFDSKAVPRPKKQNLIDKTSNLFMSFFAISKSKIGFHYKRYDKHIFPPILNPSFKALTKHNNQNHHICVYLPAFSTKELIETFIQIPDVSFHLFHNEFKHFKILKNLTLYSLSAKTFQDSLISCQSYITHAGFESTSEALLLKKPLLCIPINDHYEQQCNMSALSDMGITSLQTLDPKAIKAWIIKKKPPISIPYCTQDQLVTEILKLSIL